MKGGSLVIEMGKKPFLNFGVENWDIPILQSTKNF